MPAAAIPNALPSERTDSAPRRLLPPRPPVAVGVIAAVAGLKLLAHVLVMLFTPYGIHRDSFLYMAMGRHLRFWEMDFPPGIAVVANVARALFGDSYFGLHLFPALFGTALVVGAALIARELGGGRLAQGLAALAVLVSPLFLRAAALFQPVVLDQLWWTLGLLALARLARGMRPGAWILLGVAAGLGLLTKFSIAFFGVAVLAGVLLTPLRRDLLTPWPWVALAIALSTGSPSIVGQLRLGFPVLEQMNELRATQLHRVTHGDFIAEQFLYGPGTLLATAGVLALLFSPRLRAFRSLAWTAIAAFLLLLALQGKAYYFGPMYPALYAAGATYIEGLPSSGARLAGGAMAVLLLIFGLVTLPMSLPFLPPPVMARYSLMLGVTPALRTNRGEVGQLPQDYADLLGWEDQVRAVAAAYHDLPPEQRADAVVLGNNYGEAGAIDFYGPKYGLPDAISPRSSYWFFGPGSRPGRVVLSIGVEPEELRPYFADVRLVGRFDHPWMVSEERNQPIVVSRNPYRTLQELWPSFSGRN